MSTNQSPNSSALRAFLRRCVRTTFVQFPRVYDRASLGRNIGRFIIVLQSDKPAHCEPSGRLKTRAPADYTTTGFGAEGYLPGETTTHCVGGAVKADHDAQRVATSHGGAAWSRIRQSTLEDLVENAKRLAKESTTVSSASEVKSTKVVRREERTRTFSSFQ